MIFFLFFIAAIVIGYLMLKSPDFATAVKGVIAVLVGGNRLLSFEFERDEEAINQLAAVCRGSPSARATTG